MLVDYRHILRFFAQFEIFKLFQPHPWIHFRLSQIFESQNFWLGQNFCSYQNDRPDHNLSQGDNCRPGQKKWSWAGLGRPDQNMLFSNPVRSSLSNAIENFLGRAEMDFFNIHLYHNISLETDLKSQKLPIYKRLSGSACFHIQPISALRARSFVIKNLLIFPKINVGI